MKLMVFTGSRIVTVHPPKPQRPWFAAEPCCMSYPSSYFSCPQLKCLLSKTKARKNDNKQIIETYFVVLLGAVPQNSVHCHVMLYFTFFVVHQVNCY